jgi:hypothetical protein
MIWNLLIKQAIQRRGFEEIKVYSIILSLNNSSAKVLDVTGV